MNVNFVSEILSNDVMGIQVAKFVNVPDQHSLQYVSVARVCSGERERDTAAHTACIYTEAYYILRAVHHDHLSAVLELLSSAPASWSAHTTDMLTC